MVQSYGQWKYSPNFFRNSENTPKITDLKELYSVSDFPNPLEQNKNLNVHMIFLIYAFHS